MHLCLVQTLRRLLFTGCPSLVGRLMAFYLSGDNQKNMERELLQRSTTILKSWKRTGTMVWRDVGIIGGIDEEVFSSVTFCSRHPATVMFPPFFARGKIVEPLASSPLLCRLNPVCSATNVCTGIVSNMRTS
jgi:hypothetical protein